MIMKVQKVVLLSITGTVDKLELVGGLSRSEQDELFINTARAGEEGPR